MPDSIYPAPHSGAPGLRRRLAPETDAAFLAFSQQAKRVGRHHANYLHEQLDHGGLLLWVHISTSADEQRAVEILRKHSADCVHLHGAAEPSPVP